MRLRGYESHSRRIFGKCCVAALALLLAGPAAEGQRRVAPPLSIVTETDLPFSPSLVSLFRFNPDPYPDLLCYNPDLRQIVALVNRGDGRSFDTKVLGEATDVTYLAAKDLNGDGRDDIVIVHRAANQVEVWLSSSPDSGYASAKYAVNFYPEKVLLADIDNDSTTDILCFGKLSSGISVLRGNKDGTFREKTLILPEVPVVDASVVKLNDDDFPDLVIHNWLTNEMVFYFGMGDLQFSEQNIVSFGQDTVRTAFGDFNRDRIMDYGTASAESKTLKLFAGDGMASYTNYQSLDLARPASEITTGSLTSRFNEDLITIDRDGGTFSVFQNRGDGSFYDEIVYGCPKAPLGALVGDMDNEGWDDVVIIDSRNKSACCFWNSHHSVVEEERGRVGAREVSFAVGRKPLGLAISDFNDDGVDDIAVTNNESSTLSLLMSSAKNRVEGQLSFPTVDEPTSVRLYSKNDTLLTFLLTHESVAKVSVLTLSRTGFPEGQRMTSAYTYAISTAEGPRMFLPDATLQDQAIEFYVYSNAKQRALSYFQQVSGARFVERNFRPIIPARILAGSVNDFNDDGRPDLAYVYFDADSLRYNLGITFSDSSGQYRGKTLSYVFPDSMIKKCTMTFADVNGDNIPDCILYSTPMNSIRIALGTGAGRFGNFEEAVSGLEVSNPEHIQVVDFDGDGINDIVAAHDDTSELYFYKGKGNGRFLPGAFLLDLPKDAMFRFGDFNGDGKLDVVYTDPDRSVVTVYYVHQP